MRNSGISVVVDLLLFCALLSVGATAILLSAGGREPSYPAREEAESILSATLFSAADDVGYSLVGYRKNLAGKTWAELVSEAVFLHSEGEETGRMLLENLKPALERHLTGLSGNLNALMRIECPESGFSLRVGEGGRELAASASTTIAVAQNSELKVKVVVELWWR